MTPSRTPAPPEGWVRDGDESLTIQYAHPEKWEVGTKTEWSRVYEAQPEPPDRGLAEPPPFWFTVLPPRFKNEDASAYNWRSDEELARAWEARIGETFVSSHAPEGYNAYTRVPDITVHGFPTTAFNNPAMWEAPKGVQERRVLVKIGAATVMFGTYYKTEEELQTFEQVLASVKFGSLMLARGAASLTPQPTPTATD